MRKEREFGKITDSNVKRKFYIDYWQKDKNKRKSESNRQMKQNDRDRIMIINSKWESGRNLKLYKILYSIVD